MHSAHQNPPLDALAVVLEKPESLTVSRLALDAPGDDDVVVDIEWSGISTGTERLLWAGRMPTFPGLGYPLVPGYESVGRITQVGSRSLRRRGERVFVPGARCFGPVKGLFGGAASRLVVPEARVTPLDDNWGEEGTLLALAATAYHAIASETHRRPVLIVGHGVLGRLMARMALALGNDAVTVWETNAARVDGATGYAVLHPDADSRHDYRAIYDVSGAAGLLDTLIARLAPGGEIVLAGFYSEPLAFAFPPAFMREIRLRVAAEWRPADLSRGHPHHRRRAPRAARIDHASTTSNGRSGSLPHCFYRSLVSQNDSGLESPRMSTSFATAASLRSEQARLQALRAEATIEPDPVPDTAPTKETQVIAIYGKGGIGKSFALANLSYMMAQQGKKVLLIGCDPKSDTTSLLFGGRACPTIIETSAKKKLAGEPVKIEDVCFKRDGVFAMELGGPEVGRGCGGRGIIHGFELLEKLGFHEWGFDYVLLDFLGDVVCGGFGLPIARDMCQKVIVVGSNDLQSLYVANNVCSAVEYFRKLGGNVGVAGLVINKDDGSGEAQAFAKAAGIPVLAAIPANDDIRRKSANYDIVGRPGTVWASLFEELAANVADAPPLRPKPLSPDALLGLFKSEVTGRHYVLEPASHEDMCGSSHVEKASLEIVYDTV